MPYFTTSILWNFLPLSLKYHSAFLILGQYFFWQPIIRESENLEKATQEITSGINEMTAGTEHINSAVNHAEPQISKCYILKV